MPDFAHVQAGRLICPQCFNELADDNLVGFQWGYCYGVAAAADYQIGDAIKWRVDKNGSAYKWSYFKNGGGNIGDPDYSKLLIRESEFELRCCRSDSVPALL